MKKRPPRKTGKTTPTRARARFGAPRRQPKAQPKVVPWRKAALVVKEKHTLQRLEKFLELLKVHGQINVACRQAVIAGRAMGKQTYYDMRKQYPDFAEEADEAIAQCGDELEAAGVSCARMAVKDPRYIPMLKAALQHLRGWGKREREERREHLPGDQAPNRIEGGLALE
jgi:hypothetical protein